MEYEKILDYWFGDLRKNDYFPARKAKIWYRKDMDVDSHIIKKYSSLLFEISARKKVWKTTRGVLAMIIVLDQFSRHIYRDQKQSFSCDKLCLDLCLTGIYEKQEQDLFTVEQAFFYMPLQHSEDVKVQEKSVICFFELAKKAHPKLREQILAFHEYAVRHHDIIQRFGRFPHRNKILGRKSSPEEIKFLQKKSNF